MSGDRSLDEFASTTDETATDESDTEASENVESETVESSSDEEAVGSGDESEAAVSGGDEEAVGSEEEEGVVEPSAVTPAVATSRFVPDGAACADCGATVERLWVADGDEVCVDCKPW